MYFNYIIKGISFSIPKPFYTIGKNIELTDALELIIIEIPKAKKILEGEPSNTLAQWIMFLDNPNESEVSKIMENNKEIREAAERLEELSNDKELRLVAELKEKAIRDEQNLQYHLKHDPIKAREEGKIEEARQIAKKLKDKGIDIDLISETTGISKEEIEKM